MSVMMHFKIRSKLKSCFCLIKFYTTVTSVELLCPNILSIMLKSDRRAIMLKFMPA